MPATLSDYKYEPGERPPAVMLRDACPSLVFDLKAWLSEHDSLEIADQLDSTVVVKQRLGGSPDNFTFLAFPIPRLTLEQRITAGFRPDTSLVLAIGAATATIDIDEFGKICWFEIQNMPSTYAELASHLHVGT